MAHTLIIIHDEYNGLCFGHDCPLGISRQRKLKRCPGTVVRGRPQPSAVGLDNRAADRQPHAHALRLGCIEGGEEMVETLRIQPRARISHCDQHALRFIFPRADQQLSRPLADSTHGFDGVDDQIENHLLQLDPISQNERHFLR